MDAALESRDFVNRALSERLICEFGFWSHSIDDRKKRYRGRWALARASVSLPQSRRIGLPQHPPIGGLCGEIAPGRIKALDTGGDALDQQTAATTGAVLTLFVEREKQPQLCEEAGCRNRNCANDLLVESSGAKPCPVFARVEILQRLLMRAYRALGENAKSALDEPRQRIG